MVKAPYAGTNYEPTVLSDIEHHNQYTSGFHTGGGGGYWDFPPPPLKFENYDVIITSTDTIGYTTQ